MLMRLLAIAPALALLSTCIMRPSDTEQIRSLVQRTVDAVNRGDAGAAYRLTDLDFRSLCTGDRFAVMVREERGRLGRREVERVDAITASGARGAADVTTNGPAGAMRERWRFVKEGGRWYVYGDAAACGIAAGPP